MIDHPSCNTAGLAIAMNTSVACGKPCTYALKTHRYTSVSLAYNAVQGTMYSVVFLQHVDDCLWSGNRGQTPSQYKLAAQQTLDQQCRVKQTKNNFFKWQIKGTNENLAPVFRSTTTSKYCKAWSYLLQWFAFREIQITRNEDQIVSCWSLHIPCLLKSRSLKTIKFFDRKNKTSQTCTDSENAN